MANELLTFIREQVLSLLGDNDVRKEVSEEISDLLDIPAWLEERVLTLVWSLLVEITEQIADGETVKEDIDDIGQFLLDQLVNVLEDKALQKKIIDRAAKVSPWPDFIEKQILGRVWSIGLRALKDLIE